MVSDPDFVRLSHSAQAPSFFRIVGRAHFERWHSAFLAWLLDPAGSHLARAFALSRLLLAASQSGTAVGDTAAALEELAFAEIIEAQFAPSELLPVERSVNGVGRFDIFATGVCRPLLGERKRFNILIEVKVDSMPLAAQAKKYCDWLTSAHPQDCNVMIYLSIDSHRSRSIDPQRRWAHLSFQNLHDTVLVPIVDHPAVNPLARTLLDEYIKNLRHPHMGARMALTNEQRQIVLSLYERHTLAFDELLEVLVSEGVLGTPEMVVSRPSGRAKGRIAVRVDQTIIEDETVRGLFGKILHLIVDSKWIERLPLPWGDSASRYVVTNLSPPEHPNGRSFFYPVSYAGYSIESHYSRERALRTLANLLSALNVSFEAIPTDR